MSWSVSGFQVLVKQLSCLLSGSQGHSLTSWVLTASFKGGAFYLGGNCHTTMSRDEKCIFPQASLCACVYVYLRMVLELISPPYLFSKVSVSCWTQSLLIACQASELASGTPSSPRLWNHSRQATIPTWDLFWESSLLSSCLSLPSS